MWAWNVFIAATFEYDTPKIVHIQNKKVGVLYRLLQLCIAGFMIGSVRALLLFYIGYSCYSVILVCAYMWCMCTCVVCIFVRVCVCARVCVCMCVCTHCASSRQVQHHILEGVPGYADGDRSGHHQAERGAVLQRHGRSPFFAKLRRD